MQILLSEEVSSIMENYRITLPDGTSMVAIFDCDREAIAYAVSLNSGCSDNVSVTRITDTGEEPTMLCSARTTHVSTLPRRGERPGNTLL